LIIAWEIWKERNKRVVSNKSSMHKLREEENDWILLDAKNLAELLG
jgi:hypothetical protein